MQWFKNLNATPRLLLSFGALIVLIIGVCLLAINSLGEANRQMRLLYEDDMTGAIVADNITIARFELGRTGRDAIINMQDAAVVAADEKIMLADFEKIHSGVEAADKLFYSPEGIANLKKIREALPAYEQAYHDMFQRIEAKDLDGAKAALVTTNTVGAPLYAGANDNRLVKQTQAQDKFKLNLSSYQTARVTMLTATLFAIILGVILALTIARGFSAPLALAVGALEGLAGGDLTVSIVAETRDELGRMAGAFNGAMEKLRTTLQEVNENAVSANAASQELAAAADAIASGAQQQAASLEETSASLEQITAAVRQSADNARQASQLASGSRDSAEAGQEVVGHAVTAMAEINVASAKIADIISTIDEIAFQTNLLAVNAAVEAARAGEEGRGFAVVATEVRSLAQRSAGAAKEIKALIQDSLRKVERGSTLVNQSGETLRNIVGSVKGVTDLVNESAAAAAEQSTGVEQVNTAMTQMDQITQSNAAQTEQLSSTAQALSEQAQRLLELVGTFVLEQGGASARALPAARRSAVVRPPLRAKPKPGMRTVVTPKSKPRAANVETHAAPQTVLAVAGGHDEDSFEEF